MAFDGKYGIITAEKKQFHPGEPIFLLRGTDALAPMAIEKYADICENYGCGSEHVTAIRAHAARIAKWQEENSGLVKTPD